MKHSRLLEIDAARGTAMLLVCLSHFLLALNYADNEFHPAMAFTITAIASPAFMIISGIIFGYLLCKDSSGSGAIRSRIVARALVLLIPVHLLVRLPHLLAGDSFDDVIRVIEITDTIAIAMLVNLLLVKFRQSNRLALAFGIYVVGWFANLVWQPELPALVLVEDLLVDAAWDRTSLVHGFAFLPWVALHLASTVLGERLAGDHDDGKASFAATLAWVGIGLIVLAVVAKGAEILARDASILDRDTILGSAISKLVSLFGKYPPTPGYLELWGGASLVLISGIFTMIQRGWFPGLWRQFAIVGRASLGAWIIQAWLYWGLVRSLPVPPTIFLPVYAVATFFIVWWGAKIWDRQDINRRISKTLVRPARNAAALEGQS